MSIIYLFDCLAIKSLELEEIVFSILANGFVIGMFNFPYRLKLFSEEYCMTWPFSYLTLVGRNRATHVLSKYFLFVTRLDLCIELCVMHFRIKLSKALMFFKVIG